MERRILSSRSCLLRYSDVTLFQAWEVEVEVKVEERVDVVGHVEVVGRVEMRRRKRRSAREGEERRG
ncbi:hypothetical protein E2C01_061539 [Portunus trituberculatus]|uniref:Uncharacterized protein n=1 Tax=Portunus trituberculatus TaxID=210409 RepID=A0A5B7HFC0_PORTR|nr:hypothetical protein [Portunus trituberculatus]